MNRRSVVTSTMLSLALCACSSGPSGGTGSVQLSLKGAGSQGGQYQLTQATFTVTGQTSVTISGDPDTITQSLPVGVYSIKLENGWKLQKTVMGTNTDVTAALASANPLPFVVNSGATTNLTWLFNVSGANAEADDLEVVAVSNGALSIALAAGELAWANFSTGGLHSCGITATGQLRCWGDNTYGNLGYGDLITRQTPPATSVNVGVGRTVKRVVTGRNNPAHTCALLDDGTVKCWGYNGNGQLGYNDTTQRNLPPDPVVNLGSSNTAKTIAVGDSHTCVILDSNVVKCWGYNGNGQLGYGDTTQRNAPPSTAVNLGTGRTAKRIVAGASHTCAILDNDSVKCWGFNSSGQLGNGDTTQRNAPLDAAVNLGQGRTAKLVAAATAHTCAILDDDSIKCWGVNSSGQLGYEDVSQRSAPPALGVALGTGRVPRRLLGATDHTCALLTDNSIKCWGYNDFGQFGNGGAGERRGDQLNEMGDNLAETLP